MPRLRLTGIAKSFPGVKAIRSADLELAAGEIHALVGENGAGKSTLIKVMTGAHRPDRGRIFLHGSEQRIANPLAAQRAGVAAIYQEFSLIPTLTVRENLFLGREASRFGRLQPAEERRRARAIFQQLGMPIDTEALLRDLNIAQQQIIEIARALLADAQILIMDEPTAALTPREVSALFAVLAELRRAGRAILFVSHRLEEVLQISDRVTIMRDGETRGTWDAGNLTRARLIEEMVGRPLGAEFPKVGAPLGEELLCVQKLTGGAIRDVSFTVRSGEVLGLAGLVGAGRTELARLLFGADRLTRGEIFLAGESVRLRSPRDAIERGICLLTENRKEQGLILGLPALENFALPNLSHWSRCGWLAGGRERASFARFVESLNIRIAGPAQLAGQLSGGNQQKLLVARWLENDARVIIFDEPTRGIDVGAKVEMYNLINDLAARGKAIIMISSELPEILGMSDRVLVMRAGRLSGEVRDVAAATQEQLLELAVQ